MAKITWPMVRQIKNTEVVDLICNQLKQAKTLGFWLTWAVRLLGEYHYNRYTIVEYDSHTGNPNKFTWEPHKMIDTVVVYTHCGFCHDYPLPENIQHQLHEIAEGGKVCHFSVEGQMYQITPFSSEWDRRSVAAGVKIDKFSLNLIDMNR